MRRVSRVLDPRSQTGFALILALGTMVVLSISVTTMIIYTTSVQRTSSISSAQQRAYALAEAGVNNAMALLYGPNANAASPVLLGCLKHPQNPNNSTTPCADLTVVTAEGTAYYHGVYTQGQGNTGSWTITSYGDVANPSGKAHVKRTITAAVLITSGGQSNNISVWNYVYSTAPQGSGCEVDLNGDHVSVNVPLYVTGDLCLSGDHAEIREDKNNGGQAVDVRVVGTLTMSGNHATVGTSGNPLTSGWVGVGCNTSVGGATHPCTSADDWWVSQTDTPLTATPPTTDFPGWYANASPGPGHVCDPALTPSPNLTAVTNKFDNDATMNGTNTAFDITPKNSDYNCVTATGTLSWNHTTQNLTIKGTIFFDGNVTATADHAKYHGKASIYVNGSLLLNNNNTSIRAGCPASPAAPTRECGWGDSAKDWDPNSDMLLFVANKQSGTAIDMNVDHSEFQGDLYCTPGSTAAISGDHTKIEGGIICGKFTWGDHTKIVPMPTISNLPPGAPLPPNAPATISPPTYTGG